MGPYSQLGSPRFPFDPLVPVVIRGDRVPFPYKPFPDIPAVAGHGPDHAPEPVTVLDHDVNRPYANLPDQGALHAPSVPEPVDVSEPAATIQATR